MCGEEGEAEDICNDLDRAEGWGMSWRLFRIFADLDCRGRAVLGRWTMEERNSRIVQYVLGWPVKNGGIDVETQSREHWGIRPCDVAVAVGADASVDSSAKSRRELILYSALFHFGRQASRWRRKSSQRLCRRQEDVVVCQCVRCILERQMSD